jgi:hypothetical protein
VTLTVPEPVTVPWVAELLMTTPALGENTAPVPTVNVPLTLALVVAKTVPALFASVRLLKVVVLEPAIV